MGTVDQREGKSHFVSVSFTVLAMAICCDGYLLRWLFAANIAYAHFVFGLALEFDATDMTVTGIPTHIVVRVHATSYYPST